MGALGWLINLDFAGGSPPEVSDANLVNFVAEIDRTFDFDADIDQTQKFVARIDRTFGFDADI